MDDDLIDPGQPVKVTLIARHTSPLEWIQYWVNLGDENPDQDHSPATDPQLVSQGIRCEGQTDCAFVWTISPTTPGRYTLWGRSADRAGVLSEWTSTRLRIRDAATATPTTTVPPTSTTAPAPPTATATATATSVPATVPPTQIIPTLPTAPQVTPAAGAPTP